MKERKVRMKLLTYYLNLAELGSKEAEQKAIELGKQAFFEEEAPLRTVSKIKVIFPSGKTKEYGSATEVMVKFQLNLESLRECIELGHADVGGRLFEQIESSQ